MGRVAIFIDGGYLDKVLATEYGMARLDYAEFSRVLAGSDETLRTYYYHCPPWQGNPPTQEEQLRFSGKERFFEALRSLPCFEVRLGRLERRGVNDDGSPNFVQKRVDIQLGVDLVQLSVKHRIERAVLVTGDSDFLPAVYAAKNEGVRIDLVHGAQYHYDLWQACDFRIGLDAALVDRVRRNGHSA